MAGGAVIALQANHLGAGEILVEAQDAADLGAAPAIDRLVVIADAANIVAPARQQAQPQILRHIGILIFIDQNIFEASLILRQYLGLGGEDGQIVRQEIAEIRRVGDSKPLLIAAVKLRRLAACELCGVVRGDFIGRETAILPALHDDRKRARRPALLVDIRRPDELFQQPHLIVAVENGEIGLEADELGMAP